MPLTTLTELTFYVPLDKMGHFGDVPQADLLAWYGKTKPNTIKAHINQKKCTTRYNTYTKSKARFSCLLWHPAWKQRAPILVSALQKSVSYLLRHLPTNLQPRNPHGVPLTTDCAVTIKQLECGPMPNVMATMPNIGGALCWMPKSLADVQYSSAM